MARLLLIDDDPSLVPKQMRQAFPPPAHHVEIATTGTEGLKRFRAAPPDVILLDLRLPDRSGLSVYQAIREIDGRIPVIFITVARSADAAIEAMRVLQAKVLRVLQGQEFERLGGNVSVRTDVLTAERLGISTRTLLRKIKEYALKDPLPRRHNGFDENPTTI